jgi:hypothetical protein
LCPTTLTSDEAVSFQLIGEKSSLAFRFVEKFSGCFTDHRDPEKIEHSLVDLLKQRLFGLCLGYEDLNDHDWLRHDALLAVVVGKDDPEGNDRQSVRDQGKALAGKSTLNRLELTKSNIVAAGIWRIGSRNNNGSCLPTARVVEAVMTDKIPSSILQCPPTWLPWPDPTRRSRQYSPASRTRLVG